MSESDSDETNFDAQMKVSKIAETLSAKNMELSEHVAQLRRKVASLQKAHAEERLQLEATIKELQNKCKEVGEISEQNSDLRSQADLQTLLHALSARAGYNVCDVPEAISFISQRENVFDAVSARFDTEIDSTDGLLRFVDGLVKRISDAESESRREAEERTVIEELEGENRELQERLQNALAELAREREENAGLRRSKGVTESENERLKRSVEGDSGRIAKLEMENERLKRSADIDGARIEKLEMENTVLQGKLNEAVSQPIAEDFGYKVLYEESEKENARLARAVHQRECDRVRAVQMEQENEELKEKIRELLKVERVEPVTIKVKSREAQEIIPIESKFRIAEYETRIRELELEVKELKEQKIIHAEVEAKKDSSSDDGCMYVFEQAVETFEQCSNTNSEMLKLLTSQKDMLLGVVNKLLKGLEAAESALQVATAEKEELVAQIEELETEMETQQERYQTQMDHLVEEVARLLPKDFAFPEVERPESQIVEVVKALLKPKTNPEKKSSGNSQRELMLLSQLDKAITFIRAFATSNLRLDRSTFSEEEMARIVNEVARIQSMIAKDLVDVPASASLFTDEAPEEQMKLLAAFAKDEDIFTTPVKELYALFALAVEVNSLLFKKNKELAQKCGDFRSKLDQSIEEMEDSRDKMKSCSNIMRQITGDLDSETDIVDLANNVFREFTQLTADNIENEKSIQSLNAAISQIEQQSLEQQENEDQSRTIKRLESRLQKYKRRLIAERKERENATASSKKQVAEAVKKHQKLASDLEQVQKKLKKLGVYKERCAQFQSQIVGLEEERSTVDTEMNLVKAENERLTNAISSLNERLGLVRDALTAQTSKYAKLKSENEELRKYSTVTLQEIKNKNEGIQSGYEKRVEELESALTQKNNELAKLHEEKDKYKSLVSENKTTITKLRLSEKMLSMKLNQVNEQTQLQLSSLESHFGTKIEHMKTIHAKKVDEMARVINRAQCDLTAAIADTFGDVVDRDRKKPLDSLVSLLVDLLSQQCVKDCVAFRKTRRFKDQESIGAVLEEYSREVAEKDTKLHELELSVSEWQKESEELRAQCGRMTNMLAENTEWIKWATSLFQLLKLSAPSSPEAMRTALEELLLSSSGDTSIVKHLDTLRTTKKFLSSPTASRYCSPSKSRDHATIRSLTIVFICANRLLAAAGA